MREEQALLEAHGLKKYFLQNKSLSAAKRTYVKAVDDVAQSIREGETLGLVGESGCGKSTLGRLLLRLIEPTEGSIRYRGVDIAGLNAKEMRQMRRKMQMIFQDPYAALNPRMTVLETIQAPLDAFGLGSKREREEKVLRIMASVGISENNLYRYPHEFSGGQRQRMVIARALVLDPEFVVCDEPVSALDVSVRSQVINLMDDLQKEYRLTYLFISHDLSVIRHICDRVAVMYLGQIVELAENDALYERPGHPYTRALLSAIPLPDVDGKKNRILLEGDVPSPLNPPQGCRFHTRCRYATSACAAEQPPLREVEPGHWVACHYCGEEMQEP